MFPTQTQFIIISTAAQSWRGPCHLRALLGKTSGDWDSSGEYGNTNMLHTTKKIDCTRLEGRDRLFDQKDKVSG